MSKFIVIMKILTDKQKHSYIISKYFDGYKYGFLIRNAKMFRKPIVYPGKVRFS
jgi:hypothetical protein